MLKQWINLFGLALAVLPTASYAQPVIPAKYEWTKTTAWQGGDFSEGLVGICYEDRTCGYMNKVGQLVIMTDFGNIGDFHEGMALVTYRVNKFSVEARRRQTYGFIDKSGKMVIPLRFNKVGNFSEGLAAASIKGKWGYIDKKGKFVIPPKFSKANDFSGSVAIVEMGNDNSAIIDHRGKFIRIFNASSLQFPSDKFSEGLLSVFHHKKGFGYFNTKGKLVIPHQFAEAGDFSEGLAVAVKKAVLNDDNSDATFSGYINKLGERAITLDVKNLNPNVKLYPRSFKEGLAPVLYSSGVGGKCDYLDKNGHVIISISDTFSCRNFIEGVTYVVPRRKQGLNEKPSYFIDKSGKEVITSPPGSSIFSFHEGLSRMIVHTSGDNNAYIDKQSKIIFRSPLREIDPLPK